MELHDYGDKAENICVWPNFRPTALVFGVELEVEPRGHSSQRAVLGALPDHAANDYFCKDDGSLQAGVEIVTVPGSLTWHRTAFDWPGLLAPLLPIAMSGSRTQRCGMHIHINRRAMTALTLAKLYLFINAPENLAFMETVAQRRNSHWAVMRKKAWKDATSREAMQESGGRYQAMNVTRHTAELRLFRCTIRAERVLKNIEMAHAMVTWCGQSSAQSMQDWRKFAAYVTMSTDYPNLAAFMQETGVYA